MITRIYKASGKVQGVMFRQTLIRSAIKRGVAAGASNQADGRSVKFYLKAKEEDIDKIVVLLKSGMELNDWGAKVEDIEVVDEQLCKEEYEVTTENVDLFGWNPNVRMYL